MKDPRLVLADMLRAIERVEAAVGDRALPDYASDWLLKHAVERAIEIISEASRHLPDDVKMQHPQIEWRRVAGIGNILRHNYDHIVDEVIYRVVKLELPSLKTVLLDIQQSLDEAGN